MGELNSMGIMDCKLSMFHFCTSGLELLVVLPSVGCYIDCYKYF